jgi:hypothetical protein
MQHAKYAMQYEKCRPGLLRNEDFALNFVLFAFSFFAP